MMLKNGTSTSMAWHNHKTIWILGLVFFSSAAVAQTAPATKKPEPAPSIKPAITAPVRPYDIRERLVKLAMQNPDFEIADRQVSIAGYQVKKAKGSWLSAIAVQGNLNEFAFTGDAVGANGTVFNRSTFYPKYNIGINLPFNIISDRKNEIKIAKENLSIAEAEKNQRFRKIKAEVLTKYEDFLLSQQKLDGQSQIAQDARTTYLASEKDFQEGAVRQDEYNKSYRYYLDEKIKLSECMRNYNVIKLEIEAMIGVSLDDVLKK